MSKRVKIFIVIVFIRFWAYLPCTCFPVPKQQSFVLTLGCCCWWIIFFFFTSLRSFCFSSSAFRAVSIFQINYEWIKTHKSPNFIHLRVWTLKCFYLRHLQFWHPFGKTLECKPLQCCCTLITVLRRFSTEQLIGASHHLLVCVDGKGQDVYDYPTLHCPSKLI